MNSTAIQSPPPRRWQTWWVALGLVIVVAAVWWQIRRRGSQAQVQLAELQALGYPTTLKALETWFEPPPEPENLATVVLAAADSLREPRGNKVPLFGSDAEKLIRGQPWSPEALHQTRDYLTNNAAALDRLPELLALRRGHFTPVYTNGTNVRFTHLSTVRRLARFFVLQSGLATEEGRAHQAVESLLGAIAVVRSLDEEPFAISRLVQMALEHDCIAATERLLNRLRPEALDLERLQSTFFQRCQGSRLDQCLAGELCLTLDEFGRSPKELAVMYNQANAFGAGLPSASGWETAAFSLYRATGLQRADRAALIDLTKRYIEIARRPILNRFEPLEAWAAEVQPTPLDWIRGRALTHLSLSSLGTIGASDADAIARLRCAAAGIAIERFRSSHEKRLPDSLTELAPSLLPAVPTDPFDGKPLRFVRREAGYVIYSIGRNRVDDGGRERQPGQASGNFDSTFIVEH